MEEQAVATSRTEEGGRHVPCVSRTQGRGWARLRTGGGGALAAGLQARAGLSRAGQAGAIEAAGPCAGRPLARARGGCRGQVRVGRLRLQQAGFLADSEKMVDGRPAWLPDG